jgi:hypothetical protein
MTAPMNVNDSVCDSRKNSLSPCSSSGDTGTGLGQPAREVDLGPEPEFTSMNENVTSDDCLCVSRNDSSETSQPLTDTPKSRRRPNRKVVKNLEEVQDMTNSISPSNRPDKAWTLETLENYARDRADEISNFGRKTIVETWLFGESLALIRNLKKEDRGWMNWVKSQPYSLSTATNAIKVYERVKFDELTLFKDMTVSDLKSALEIIKSPPPQRRRIEKAVPVSQEVLKDHTTSEKVADTDSGSLPEDTTVETNDEAPEKATIRKMATTDYTQPSHKKSPAPEEVGPSLTACEVLGRAFTFLVEAEKLGITPDCKALLTQISAKVAALVQALDAEVAG